MKHKMFYTYARGRVRVSCSCGQAQTKWMASNTQRAELQKALQRAHPQLNK